MYINIICMYVYIYIYIYMYICVRERERTWSRISTGSVSAARITNSAVFRAIDFITCRLCIDCQQLVKPVNHVSS